MTDPKERGFYTVEEVADMFHVTKITVYSWIKKGKLKAVKLGQWKIPLDAVDINKLAH